tara:strand:+ start:1917 stop:2060 length:144 start_codon:yes stop_codon:yes gene_type:complete
MGTILISIVSVIYLGVAASMLMTGQHGMALAFFAYALANVGLIMAAN